MSSQDAIADSDSLKSRSKGHSLITRLFTFEGNGSLKDRLLTALIVLTSALALSLLALYVPYGRLITVAVSAFIAIGSAFEVVRLFARDAETLRYKPLVGAIQLIILALPALAATFVAVDSVIQGTLSLRWLYGALLVSGPALMVAQAVAGRRRLEDAARFSERYPAAFLIVGICAPQLIVLSSLPYGVQLLWWIVGVVALNDATAYFVGSSFGKHKIAPGLSPNKSVEGSVAGLAMGTVAGVFFWRLLLGDVVTTGQLLAVSFAMTVVAQAGDLAKSYLKRLRGVKDTGAIFPGHGGILDRFDALISAAPIVLLMLFLVGVV